MTETSWRCKASEEDGQRENQKWQRKDIGRRRHLAKDHQNLNEVQWKIDFTYLDITLVNSRIYVEKSDDFTKIY